MRIAFTHNLQLRESEEEAEFDTPATVQWVTEGLRALGHEVEPVEVSGPASRVVARLEALAPDLVFNTAEGRQGRFREAFFPALFDQLVAALHRLGRVRVRAHARQAADEDRAARARCAHPGLAGS